MKTLIRMLILAALFVLEMGVASLLALTDEYTLALAFMANMLFMVIGMGAAIAVYQIALAGLRSYRFRVNYATPMLLVVAGGAIMAYLVFFSAMLFDTRDFLLAVTYPFLTIALAFGLTFAGQRLGYD